MKVSGFSGALVLDSDLELVQTPDGDLCINNTRPDMREEIKRLRAVLAVAQEALRAGTHWEVQYDALNVCKRTLEGSQP